MKFPPSAIPVVVAIVGLSWLGARQREIQELRSEKDVLPEPRVAAAAMPPAGRTIGMSRPVEPEQARVRRLARAFDENRGGRWLRTDLREVGELEEMSREELISALDALAELDLTGEGPLVLKSRLIDLLEKIDPAYVTRRFGELEALALWAERDPAAAMAWSAEQAARKPKDTEAADVSNKRIEMTRSLVWALVSSDPAAAGRMLEALPVAERVKVFEKRYSPGGWSMGDKNLQPMAKLLRAHVPESEQIGIVTWPFWELGDFGEGGLIQNWEQLDRYFADIKATPEERGAVALAVAQTARFPRASDDYFHTITEDLDGLRAWVARENPKLLTEATAAALQTVANRSEQEFPPWVDYALRLHAAGEGDEVLVAVLETYRAPQHPELLRLMAERLSPGLNRERFLEQLDKPAP